MPKTKRVKVLKSLQSIVGENHWQFFYRQTDRRNHRQTWVQRQNCISTLLLNRDIKTYISIWNVQFIVVSFLSQNPDCPHGFFANNCSEKCIDTCAGCNNINGLCESGCIPGWKGDLCSEGVSNFKSEFFKEETCTWTFYLTFRTTLFYL